MTRPSKYESEYSSVVNEDNYTCVWFGDLDAIKYEGTEAKARHNHRGRIPAKSPNGTSVKISGGDVTKLTAQWSEMNLRTRREFGMPDAMPAVEEKAGGVYLPIRLWRRGILAPIILMLIGGKWVRIGGILFPWAPITWNIDKHCGFGVYGYMCLLLLWERTYQFESLNHSTFQRIAYVHVFSHHSTTASYRFFG